MRTDSNAFKILAAAAVLLLFGGCSGSTYAATSPEMLFSVEFGASRALVSQGEFDMTAAGEDTPAANTSDQEIGFEVKYHGGRETQASSGPQILIYHTHTTEAYRQAYDGEYIESEEWRTTDESKNIVAVGELLRQELTYKYGFDVVHDKTDHEPPKLATSYTRSLETMERYKKEYPSIDIFIDIHRDAADIETDKDDVVSIDGLRCARVMCVVGMGTSKGTAALDKPYFDENYAFAEAFCAKLDAEDPAFTRTIRVKAGRYNQHMSPSCLLIEVGHNANTLSEALNSVPFIAKALSECIDRG